MFDLVGRSNHWPTGLTLAGCAAVFWASNMAWAVTLAFPQYTGGLVWLIVLVTLSAAHRLQALRAVFLAADATWPDIARSAGAALICPIFLVAQPEVSDAMTLMLVTAAAFVPWIWGLWLIRTLDVPLEDPR
jgi:hypothetical protein